MTLVLQSFGDNYRSFLRRGGERVDKQTVMTYVLMILSPVAGMLLAVVLARLIG